MEVSILTLVLSRRFGYVYYRIKNVVEPGYCP